MTSTRALLPHAKENQGPSPHPPTGTRFSHPLCCLDVQPYLDGQTARPAQGRDSSQRYRDLRARTQLGRTAALKEDFLEGFPGTGAHPAILYVPQMNICSEKQFYLDGRKISVLVVKNQIQVAGAF